METELTHNLSTPSGNKIVIVPLDRLAGIRRDLTDLASANKLNEFQTSIINNLYKLDPPELGFKPMSIILAASPSPAQVQLAFNWKGKVVKAAIPAAYVDSSIAPERIKQDLLSIFAPAGYNVKYAADLPHKLLAVRSGLGVYGRNNICYVEGMGSFLNLVPFYSDAPPADHDWYDIRMLKQCTNCTICLKNCPTGAISGDRFLIDNKRCLTHFNEAGRDAHFPDWIPLSVHNALYGCNLCQLECPVNKPYLGNTIELAAFDAAETEMLYAGKPFKSFPGNLQQKISRLNMYDLLDALPRNLGVLFKQLDSD